MLGRFSLEHRRRPRCGSRRRTRSSAPRCATWLEANLTGEFAGLRGAGGPGREHERHDERLAWNRHLAAAGWTCLGWPAEHGGRGATLTQQVIFYEEYARADAPARVSIVGEELLGPTLIAFGTPDQQQRFLPPIRAVTRAVVPGLLRTRGRVRPGQRGHPGGAWTGTNG